MASSSSSKHDVFLSFRGEDTRDNIISHLLKALQTTKIPTFSDYELNRGDEISPALISAIEQSKISVIIFSENYADSRWCLDELVKILECRKDLNQIVIPVFYKVEPTDVRNQTGEFGAAFLKNIAASKSDCGMRRCIPTKYCCFQSRLGSREQEWRNALKEAANLSGRDSSCIGSTLCRSEAILVDTIVADVLKKLEKGSNNSYVDSGLFGINSRVESIISLLRIESPPSGFRMVGIWGMGGIGKTTISQAVFNKISCKFESCCFMHNVRETAKKDGLPKMRNDLISQLLKFENSSYGVPYTSDRLRRTRVLIVLDDVDQILQLEGLIGGRGMDPFGPGSRVIVTTRDKQILRAHDIKDEHVYDMQILDDDQALQLFSYHAFPQKQPVEPYLEFSKKMVEYAKGAPLALKVLGSSLRGKTDLRHWEGALRKLRNAPDMRISDVLKISYDSLEDEEKNMFLDIACFFKHHGVESVRNVLDGSYDSGCSGMDVLLDKSLISYKTHHRTYETVEMHDLVQEMGWNIVIGESKNAGSRSRLWRDEDVRDVLTRNRGTENVKCILLFHESLLVNEMSLAPETFEKMYNLKFLLIMDDLQKSKIQFPSGLTSLPDGLRYLLWKGCHLEYLPPSFNPTHLVELRLYSGDLKRLWTGKQNLYNLKAITLMSCYHLTEFPDLSLARNLEKLHISYCPYLVEIPSSIQYLNNITHLNFSSCKGLVEIPSFIKHFNNLISLQLYECRNLERIPNDINCISLRNLDLRECIKIIKIPYLSKNITSLHVDGTLMEQDLSSIAFFTELVTLTLANRTDYQKSPAFLQRIINRTPPNCEIWYEDDDYGADV